jgi:hypothetical protein
VTTSTHKNCPPPGIEISLIVQAHVDLRNREKTMADWGMNLFFPRILIRIIVGFLWALPGVANRIKLLAQLVHT